ncbi:questin oxidase family protein [Fodinicola acaciae]|uniref:questin oxidase family protein n=1 Tax=Fodinicola acaciae TaxID=2681555 RepID=UPI001C9E41DB|nr:questin oxidase family protein [Fodinicola acaciae]
MDSETLNEAYGRLHHAGPEWGEDRLTNHGPMAVEVLVRRGRADRVHRWVDAYLRRLDDMPAAGDPITAGNWREAMGDGRRIADWTAFFQRQLAERPWRDALAQWWPRLLPGIAAGATHGVIRVSHAVRALLAGDQDAAAVTELAHGLAFWAARMQHVPGSTAPAGKLPAAEAFDAIPRVPSQAGRIADRFGQLESLPSWGQALASLRAPAGPDEAAKVLADLVAAATAGYLSYGHGSPVLLVHTATAPNAVLHTLPALPRELWTPSLAAVWSTSAAITASYAPPQPADDLPAARSVEDTLAYAVDHGDEHVIKFADTAVDAFRHNGDPASLAAAARVGLLIPQGES